MFVEQVDLLILLKSSAGLYLLLRAIITAYTSRFETLVILCLKKV
jgi:hypothetical protein